MDTTTIPPRRLCGDCGKTYPADQFATWNRCDSCQSEKYRLYSLNWRARRRALLPPVTDRRGYTWLPDELARLKQACEQSMFVWDAAEFVGGKRSEGSCYWMMTEQGWRGLRLSDYDRKARPVWSDERTERLKKFVDKYGPCEAARRLELSKGAVIGALYRFRKRNSA